MKPILFNTEMVRAILDGRKTMTRRVVKPQPPAGEKVKCYSIYDVVWYDSLAVKHWVSPPYLPGDILYVREAWTEVSIFYPKQGEYSQHFLYKASDLLTLDLEFPEAHWKPSILMPKAAARIFLRVTDVQVERLQAITKDETKKEGVPCNWPMDAIYCPQCHGNGLIDSFNARTLGHIEIDCPYCMSAINRFRNLWDATIQPKNRDKYGWAANPLVWVISFEEVSEREANVWEQMKGLGEKKWEQIKELLG